jgi:hypothetical protein
MIHAKQKLAKVTARSPGFRVTGAKPGPRVSQPSVRSYRRLGFDDAQCHFIDERVLRLRGTADSEGKPRGAARITHRAND